MTTTYEINNIGAYNDNYKLYEVTSQNIYNGKPNNSYSTKKKTTYAVANSDYDKFEKYFEKENELQTELQQYKNTREYKRKQDRNLKNGMALGMLGGIAIPLSVFFLSKTKVVKVFSVITSVIGGITGLLLGGVAGAMVSTAPTDLKIALDYNSQEFKKLDCTKIKEESIRDYNKLQ